MILEGDALHKLQELDENSIDAIITDPPYGYSFMNKAWDKAVIGVETWKECLRVLKPGAFAAIMSSPRQDVLSRMIVNLQDAGFRTDFTSIYWTYASGFPKSSNISKLVDKKLGAIPVSKEAKKLDGSYAGFQPKPALEVILMVMKPLSEKTYVDQALKNGKGITWLDSVRIPFQDNKDIQGTKTGFEGFGWSRLGVNTGKHRLVNGGDENLNNINSKGRFPANLLVSDDVLNDGKITKSTGGANNGKLGQRIFGHYKNNIIGTGAGGYGDTGSYSHYFDLDKWFETTFPFIITPKPSPSERRGSTHPTQKPIKLMSYLVTLLTKEGDTVLDPFTGSGTTLIAAKILHRKYVGIELNPEYIEIAKARLNAYG